MSGSVVDQVQAFAGRLPWWGWAIAGGAGLGGVYYLQRSGVLGQTGATGVPASSAAANSDTAATTGAQPEYQPPDGLSMSDLAGLPYDYYDWSAALTPGGQPLPTASPQPTPTPATTPTPAAPGSTSSAPSGTPAPPHPATTPSPSPTPTRQPQPATATQPTHQVHAWPAWDSTLSGIAAHYGMSWEQLYHYGNDKSIIDAAAHAHGHYSQEYNWLFPDEVLQVPY